MNEEKVKSCAELDPIDRPCSNCLEAPFCNLCPDESQDDYELYEEENEEWQDWDEEE